MRISLIITNDYEVYGNGKGDVDDLIIKPTYDISAALKRWGASQTIFFDVVEYWRFKEAEDSCLFGSDYRFASLMEDQVRAQILEGDDVQLHVHPQWLLAKPVERAEWNINSSHWRTAKLPDGIGDVNNKLSLRGLFYHGKKTLESMIRPVKPDYVCNVFRAGGYCIQPEKDVLQALRENGFRVDSSVCPGRSLDRDPAYFDFRTAPRDLAFWRISDKVDSPNNDGDLLELPVGTGFQSRFCPRRATNLSTMLSCLRRLILPRQVNLDFCKLTGPELIWMTKCLITRLGRHYESSTPLPVTLIGHSKEWTDSAQFEMFLEWASKDTRIDFMSISQWLATYDEK